MPPEHEEYPSTPLEGTHWVDRTDNHLVNRAELEEKCRGCHMIDNMKHDESAAAIDRLVKVMEKLDAKLESYIPPVVHWVGEIKTGALGFMSALVIAMMVYIATH